MVWFVCGFVLGLLARWVWTRLAISFNDVDNYVPNKKEWINESGRKNYSTAS